MDSFSTCRQLEGAVGSAVEGKMNALDFDINTLDPCEDVNFLICIMNILWHIGLQIYGVFQNNYQ